MESREAKTKRERLEYLILLLIGYMGDQVQLYASSKISLSTFGGLLLMALSDGHAEAFALGKQHPFYVAVREHTSVTKDDHTFGKVVAVDEAQYLDKFLGDIKDGRYSDDDGKLKDQAITARLALYAAKLRSSAYLGFIDASPEGSLFDWVLDDGAAHCRDCPRWSANGPYTADTLPATPGDGKSECLTNCRCRLVRVSDNADPFG